MKARPNIYLESAGSGSSRRTAILRPLAAVVLSVLIFALLLAGAGNFAEGAQQKAGPNLLADGQFVYGPNVDDFTTTAYIESNVPSLAEYAQPIETWAAYYSINPKVLLTFLEMEGAFVSSPSSFELQANDPFGLSESGFATQIERIASTLFTRFYWHLYSYEPFRPPADQEFSVALPNGQVVPLSSDINSGTYALLGALAEFSTPDEWDVRISRDEPAGFYQTYRRLFPKDDPLDNSNNIRPQVVPPADLLLQFPFPVNEAWKFSGGPHPMNPDKPGTVFSSVDFAPGGGTCQAPPEDKWAVAVADGEVDKASGCRVILDHGGGWRTSYYHLRDLQVTTNDTASRNMSLGKVGCVGDDGKTRGTVSGGSCPGTAYGPHVHFSLMFNGGFVAINGTVLSGWTVHEGAGSYQGSLTRGSETIGVGGEVRNEGVGEIPTPTPGPSPTPGPTPTPGVPAPGRVSALYAVDFVDDNNGWAVGGDGNILHTENGGNPWLFQLSGASARLNDVSFVDVDRGWVVGDSGVILKTQDGGESWFFPDFPTNKKNLHGVHFIDPGRGWVVGAEGLIFATNDGGNTWQPQNSRTSMPLYGVYFVGAGQGWAVGAAGTILHTTNGGDNWTDQSNNNVTTSTTSASPSAVADRANARLNDVFFLDKSRGWIVGDKGTILHTTDGGETWTRQDSSTLLSLNGLDFFSGDKGWTVGDRDTVRLTVTGGRNWMAERTDSGAWLTDVRFVGDRKGWATGYFEDGQGVILYTEDGGQTWVLQEIITGPAQPGPLPPAPPQPPTNPNQPSPFTASDERFCAENVGQIPAGGSVDVPLTIARYYGPVSADGMLDVNYVGKSIAEFASLSVKAAEVATLSVQVNDHQISGNQVDVRWLKMPDLGDEVIGVENPDPSKANNEIRITNDGSNQVTIQSVCLDISGIRPVLFVRGFNLEEFENFVDSGQLPSETRWNTWDTWKDWINTTVGSELQDRQEDSDLANHYAPIWYQDVVETDDSQELVRDFIVKFDFDENFAGIDNWQSLENIVCNGPLDPDCEKLNAYIYYAVTETETHWFITYAAFHPQDRKNIPGVDLITAHENDMEGVVLVVAKDGQPYGTLQLMLTQAHGFMRVYQTDDPNEVVLRDGSHPLVYAQPGGHGVYSRAPDGVIQQDWDDPICIDSNDFCGKVYEPGNQSNYPVPIRGREEVEYELIPLNELWERQLDEFAGNGVTQDQAFHGFGNFRGDDRRDNAASPPWGWGNQTADPGECHAGDAGTVPNCNLQDSVLSPFNPDAEKGAVFLCPADFLVLEGRDPSSDFSLEYVYNPYAPPHGVSSSILCLYAPGYLHDEIKAPNVLPDQDGTSERLFAGSDSRVPLSGLLPATDHAETIQQQINDVTQKYGVAKVNLIGHSKGGLDIRSLSPEIFGETVDTAILLNSPHDGVLPVLSTGLDLYLRWKCPGLGVEIFGRDVSIPQAPGCEMAKLTAKDLTEDGAKDLEDQREKLLAAATQSRQPRFAAIGGTDCNLNLLQLPIIGDVPVSCGSGKFGEYSNINDGVIGTASQLAVRRDLTESDGQSTHSVPPNSYIHWFADTVDLDHSETVIRRETFEKVKRFLVPPSSQIGDATGEIVRQPSIPQPNQWPPQDVQLLQTTSRSLQQAPVIVPTLQVAAAISGTIAASNVQTHTMALEGELSVVSLNWSSADTMTLTLRNPLGELIDPTSPPSNITHTASIKDKSLHYAISTPQPGIWTTTVGVTNPPVGGENYLLSNVVLSDILLETRLDKDTYAPGKPITITAVISDADVPVPRAAVTATASVSNTVLGSVILHDDGLHSDKAANDGIYANIFTDTGRSGLYAISIRGTGESNTVPFTRLDTLFTTVNSGAAVFTDNYAEEARDTDGDGLYNTLVITTGVRITEAGRYRISGLLTDDAGTLAASASAVISDTPGVYNVPLAFDGEAITFNDVDGPYELRDLTLTDQRSVPHLLADKRDLAYVTGVFYTADLFQSESIAVRETVTDRGVDLEGNGLYDYLRVTIPVNVVASGNYTVSARLVDPSSQQIATVRKSVSLGAGNNIIRLDFSGGDIRASVQDGPYTVRDVLIEYQPDPNVYLQFGDFHTTAAYDSTEFELPSNFITLQSPVTDQGIDLDSNGLYDLLRVTVPVNVAATGDYSVTARLVSPNPEDITAFSKTISLTTGANFVPLDFAGKDIRAVEKDGPYSVQDLQIAYEPDPGIQVSSTDFYTTAGYAASDFEIPCVQEGDVTGNGTVNVLDAATAANAWKTQLGDPGYLPAADLVPDNVIRVDDLMEIITRFGQSCLQP